MKLSSSYLKVGWVFIRFVENSLQFFTDPGLNVFSITAELLNSFDSPNLERRSTSAAFSVAHLCQKTEITQSLPIVFNMFVGLDSRQAICYFGAQKVIQDYSR